MNSGLDSIFRTTFRTTEQTDSWLGIRREDAQDGRKRKDHDPKEDQVDIIEEGATLSLPALYGFLNGLVSGTAPETEQTATETAPPPEPPAPTPPPNPQAIAAARAYQTSSRSTGTPHVDLHDAPPVISAPTIDLSAEEIRIIHQLLRDIDVLAARNVMTIPLRPAENFLGSLVAGVEEMMNVSGA